MKSPSFISITLCCTILNLGFGQDNATSKEYKIANYWNISNPIPLISQNADSIDCYITEFGELLEVTGNIQIANKESYHYLQQGWFPLNPNDNYKGVVSPVLKIPSNLLIVARINIIVNALSASNPNTIVCYLIDPSNKQKYIITDFDEFIGNEGWIANPHFTSSKAKYLISNIEKMKNNPGLISDSDYNYWKGEFEKDMFRGIDTNCNTSLLMAMGKISKNSIWKNSNFNLIKENVSNNVLNSIINHRDDIGWSKILGLKFEIDPDFNLPRIVEIDPNGLAKRNIQYNIWVGQYFISCTVTGEANRILFKDFNLDSFTNFLDNKFVDYYQKRISAYIAYSAKVKFKDGFINGKGTVYFRTAYDFLKGTPRPESVTSTSNTSSQITSTQNNDANNNWSGFTILFSICMVVIFWKLGVF